LEVKNTHKYGLLPIHPNREGYCGREVLQEIVDTAQNMGHNYLRVNFTGAGINKKAMA
jgi:alpha/beta superfamily hydrolase